MALLGEFLPLDEERAVDACVWMAFKNAARTKPFLAAEADRSHRAVAAVVGGLILGLAAAARSTPPPTPMTPPASTSRCSSPKRSCCWQSWTV